MSKSIKFKNNNYLDTSSITHGQVTLDNILNNKIIYESGSNENGEYIKYADGTMICTQQIELTNISINATWGAWYTYVESGTNYHYFPQQFTEVNSFHIDILNQGTGNFGFIVGDTGRRKVDTEKWTGIALIRPTSATGVNATLCVTAIGRWK